MRPPPLRGRPSHASSMQRGPNTRRESAEKTDACEFVLLPKNRPRKHLGSGTSRPLPRCCPSRAPLLLTAEQLQQQQHQDALVGAHSSIEAKLPRERALQESAPDHPAVALAAWAA